MDAMTQRWMIPVILLSLVIWTPTGWSVVHAQGQRDIGVAPIVMPASVPISGEYWALIIGIDDYQHAPNLESAVKDATAVRDVLKDRYGFQQNQIWTACSRILSDSLARLGPPPAPPYQGGEKGEQQKMMSAERGMMNVYVKTQCRMKNA